MFFVRLRIHFLMVERYLRTYGFYAGRVFHIV